MQYLHIGVVVCSVVESTVVSVFSILTVVSVVGSVVMATVASTVVSMVGTVFITKKALAPS